MRLAPLVLLLCVAFSRVVAADSSEELLAQARALDLSLKADQALRLYQQVELSEPDRLEVLIGIARQYRHLMADASDTKEKLRLIDLALTYSQRAVKQAPDNADAHLAMAITYGKRAALEGSRDQVATSRLLRAEIDRTLKLDPRNDLAWHLLGRWSEGYADLSSARRAVGEMLFGKLPTSTYEDAAGCFQKAMAANPNRLMHYIELGRVYAIMGRPEEAKKLLKKGLSMPNRDKDDPTYKQRGKEALDKLK